MSTPRDVELGWQWLHGTPRWPGDGGLEGRYPWLYWCFKFKAFSYKLLICDERPLPGRERAVDQSLRAPPWGGDDERCARL